MAVKTLERCLRCGTIMRNGRAICPSCGWDPKAPPPEEIKNEAPQEKGPKKVAAKAGVKMCQICMSSVPEEQMVEHEGQKICPACAENMRNKMAKKAAPPSDKDKEKK